MSAGNTDTWSSAETPAGPQADKNCPLCRGAGFLHPRLTSGKADFSRVVACRCLKKSIEKERVGQLQEHSNLGAMSRFTFANLQTEGRSGSPGNQQQLGRALETARSFALKPKGWLTLVGPSGSGKTHLAAAIANEVIKNNGQVFFQSVPDLLDHLRSTFAPGSEMPYDELFERVSTVPLLILDDLGVQAGTAWAREKMDQILDHRFIHELPTVITTSQTLDELDERTRTRLMSKRISQVCVIEDRPAALQEYSWTPAFELQKSMTFKNFDSKRLNLPADQRQNLEAAYQLAVQYAESPDGWLVFQGVNGCGKTHLAAAIVNHRYEARKPALFVVVPELLDHLRKTFNPESKVSYDQLFEAVKKAPLLVLDDFGEQSTTQWAQEKLYQVLNYRYNARSATVITTSFSLDELEARISSRLVDQKISMVINITAPDYRGDKSSNPNAGKRQLRRGRKPSAWGQD
jgi:DNA replication protein DnaC